MTDTNDAVRTAAVSTALSAVAGIIGGPVMAAVTGFLTGLPIPLILTATLTAVIWISPITGLWLAITALAATGGFILGAIRTPPPGFFRALGHTPASDQIAHLHDQLATARAREHALTAALTAAHCSQPPVTRPARIIRDQVRG
jgi:hypothetical protein